MRRIGKLFEPFCSFESLLAAARRARQGSRLNREASEFMLNLEYELLRLQEELHTLAYQPRPYRYFDIFDPKHRTISVAAFRDRVVHHALVGVLEPVYERRFIFDSYATRKGKGVHTAVLRAQDFLRKKRWFFKTDIEKYFDSIDHDILLGILARKIKDERLLEIAKRIIQNGGTGGKGLPIGNLTSQFFANVYLDPFDHFVQDNSKGILYIRYMDDFVLFSEDKSDLKQWRPLLEGFLAGKLALHLNLSATFLNSRRNGLPLLGMRVFPNVIRFRRENLRRITGRLRFQEKRYLMGQMEEDKFLQSAGSYWAMLSFYPHSALRNQLLAQGWV